MSSTFQLAATLLAGLGLFFVGLKFIAGNLKNIAGRTFRDVVAQMSAGGVAGGAWGALSGFVTQSGRTTSYIVASFVHSGLLPPRRALPVVLWANFGCALLVIAAIIPVQFLVLLLVGFSGLCLAFEFPHRLRNAYGAIFGVALLLFGLTLIKSGASGFIGLPLFQTLLDITRDSDLMAFLTGLLLTFIAQSHIGVILIAIAMTQAGFFTLDQMLMIVYGTHVGSSCITYALGVNFRGSAEQAVMAQVFYNLVGAALFTGLFYAEAFGVPLVKAVTALLSTDASVQAACAAILFNLITPALLTVFAGPYHRLLERCWPPSEEESLSQTKYLHEDAVDQPETAALLVEKEQLRLLHRLPGYLDALRTDQPLSGKPGPGTHHAAFGDIAERILAFLADVLHGDASAEASERLLNLRNRQDLLAEIEKDLFGLYQTLRERPGGGKAAQLALGIVEVLDTILLTLLAAAETGEPGELETLGAMTADRGEMMERVRKSYLSAEENLAAEDRALVLYITHLFERTAWSLGRYGQLLARAAAAR